MHTITENKQLTANPLPCGTTCRLAAVNWSTSPSKLFSVLKLQSTFNFSAIAQIIRNKCGVIKLSVADALITWITVGCEAFAFIKLFSTPWASMQFFNIFLSANASHILALIKPVLAQTADILLSRTLFGGYLTFETGLGTARARSERLYCWWCLFEKKSMYSGYTSNTCTNLCKLVSLCLIHIHRFRRYVRWSNIWLGWDPIDGDKDIWIGINIHTIYLAYCGSYSRGKQVRRVIKVIQITKRNENSSK